MITENSTIDFHELRFGLQADEHKLFGVVRWDTDDSLKVDKDVMAIVQFLKQGKTVKEVAKIINFSPIVIITVLHMLEKANFIKNIDHVRVENNATKIKPWLTSIHRKWFRWIISKPVIILITLFAVMGTLLGIIINGIPSYKAFFWTTDIFVVFVSLTLAETFLVLMHEFSHFFVTKAVGGEAVMRINYRYIFIVFETESYHLAIIPKKLRYYVYLSGLIFDVFIIALLYMFILIIQIVGVHLGIWYNFLIAIILSEIIGIIWQFDVFLETDMYNFLSAYWDIENLRNDALKFIDEHTEKWKKTLLFPIKNILRIISNNYAEESDNLRLLSKNDKKKIRIYIFILVGGLMVITLQYLFYSIPRDFTFVYQSIKDAIKATKTFDIITLLKSAVVILLILLDYILLLYLWTRKSKNLKKRRQGIFRR